MTDPNEPTSDAPAQADDAQPQPQDEATDTAAEEIAATVEAVIFSSDSPLSAGRIGAIAELPAGSVKKAIARLNERYEAIGAVFRIEEIAGGYQMMSQPQYHDVLARLVTSKKDTRLTQASLETLAIVAYRQPILRADIEAIRGVASGEVLRGLMERQLIKIVGRAEVIGRPMLYGTTKQFLEIFGLASLDDLPRMEELRALDAPQTEAVADDEEDEIVLAAEADDADELQADDAPSDEDLDGEDEFGDEDEFDEDDFEDEDEDEDD